VSRGFTLREVFCGLCLFLMSGVVWDACSVSRWDGAGTMTWPDGVKYVGNWKDGNMNGHGMSCGCLFCSWVFQLVAGEESRRRCRWMSYHLFIFYSDLHARGFLWRHFVLILECVGNMVVPRGDDAGTITGGLCDKYVGEFKDGKAHGQGMSCARGDES
jgi:hypothetical protein